MTDGGEVALIVTDPVWYPANVTERRMAWALGNGEVERFFRIVALAEFFVPLGPPGDGLDGRQWVTVTEAGRVVVPVFTSYQPMDAIVGDLAEGFVRVDFPDLRRSWPHPEWPLAINPGMPIRATVPVGRVEQLGERYQPGDPEVAVARLYRYEWEPWPHGPHQAMRDAAHRQDLAEYADALAGATVTFATEREVADVMDLLLDSRFPWLSAPTAVNPLVELFTTAEAVGQAYPDRPSLTATLAAVVENLPDGYALSVDPGEPAGLDVPADQVGRLRAMLESDPATRPAAERVRWNDQMSRWARWSR